MSSINPILKKAMKGTASIAAALTYGIAINLRIGFRGVEGFSLLTSIFLKNSQIITNSLEMLFKSRVNFLCNHFFFSSLQFCIYYFRPILVWNAFNKIIPLCVLYLEAVSTKRVKIWTIHLIHRSSFQEFRGQASQVQRTLIKSLEDKHQEFRRQSTQVQRTIIKSLEDKHQEFRGQS